MNETLPLRRDGLWRRSAAIARSFARNDGGPMLIAYTIAMMVLRLASNVVLSRLLEPRAFGVMGMILSIMMILTMLSDLGFASFVIRHEKGDDPVFLDVLWTIRLGQSLVQALVMAAGAVPIALLLGKAALTMPIMACAPLFVLTALCPMAVLLAQRQGQVRKTCAIDLGALAIQIALNLLLAIVLRDYRALIVGLYVSTLAKAALTLILFRRPSRLRFDRAVAREFFGFSRIIMASTFVTLLISQSDKMVFVRLFTLADFGVYMMAANLALAAQPFGHDYVQRIFFPLVSRVWRDTPEDLPGIFYEARRHITLLLFAGFGLAIGLAPVVFAILFDHRYAFGWIFLAILLVRTALDLDNFAGMQTLLAMGRTTTWLHSNLLRLAALLLAIWPFYRLAGPVGVPIALTFSEFAATAYVIFLLWKVGLFRPARHALYYAVMLVAIGIGAAISLAIVPDMTLAAFTRTS